MISLFEKFKPFSHKPGISCLLPQTSYEVEVFPSLVRIYDIKTGKRECILEEEIPIQGPLKDFTVVQDLERNIISVFGKNLFYHIKSDLSIVFQKKMPFSEKKLQEKLFFGVHKQQDWEKIVRRKDFGEILPFWFALGSGYGNIVPPQKKSGIFSLLDECQEVIFRHRPEHILSSFEKVFLAGFRGILVPRLKDEDYQGIVFEEAYGNPLYLLSYGYHLLRSLFIEKRKESLHILPNLPPSFFSGKLINVEIPPYGIFALEWSKKTIRRIHIESSFEGYLPLVFSSHLKQFRFRKNLKERGKSQSCKTPLEISKGTFYLDRFEK